MVAGTPFQAKFKEKENVRLCRTRCPIWSNARNVGGSGISLWRSLASSWRAPGLGEVAHASAAQPEEEPRQLPLLKGPAFVLDLFDVRCRLERFDKALRFDKGSLETENLAEVGTR